VPPAASQPARRGKHTTYCAAMSYKLLLQGW
jgi:hypothetical protein